MTRDPHRSQHSRELRAGSRAPPTESAELLAELDLARDLVGGQVARAVVDDVLGAAHAGAHDARHDHRAAEVVGDDAGLRRLDLGERLQASLDLAQRDALAVDLDQIVLAAGDGRSAPPCPAGRGRRCAASRRRRRRRSGCRRRASAGASSGPPSVDSAAERTQIGPASPAGSRSPFGPATRSSTPSNGCPTLSGILARRDRSRAARPACCGSRRAGGRRTAAGSVSAIAAGSAEPELRKRAPPFLSGLTVGTRTSAPYSAGVPAKKSILCSRSSLAMRLGEISSSRNSVAPWASARQQAEVEAVARVQRHRAQHAIRRRSTSSVLPIAWPPPPRGWPAVLTTPLGSPPTVAVNCTTVGLAGAVARLASGARL